MAFRICFSESCKVEEIREINFEGIVVFSVDMCVSLKFEEYEV
jgi:hypothetical protein